LDVIVSTGEGKAKEVMKGKEELFFYFIED